MSSKDIKWPVAKVRSAFVEYFAKNHQHVNVKSSPVVPVNVRYDTSLFNHLLIITLLGSNIVICKRRNESI